MESIHKKIPENENSKSETTKKKENKRVISQPKVNEDLLQRKGVINETKIAQRRVATKLGGPYKCYKITKMTVHESVFTCTDARNYIAKFEYDMKGIEVKMKSNIREAPGQYQTFESYIKILHCIIPCYLICNCLDKAEKLIEFALSAVIESPKETYNKIIMGSFYYMKFHLLLQKMKRDLVKARVQNKEKNEIENVKGETRKCNSLIIYNLEMAVKYGNDLAVLACVVFNLDPQTSEFPANPARAFEVLDIVIDKVNKPKRQLKPKDASGILEIFIINMLERINDVKTKQPDRKCSKTTGKTIVHRITSRPHYQAA